MRSSRLKQWMMGLRFGLDCMLIPFVIVVAYALKFKLTWLFETFFSVSVGQVYHHADFDPYFSVAGLVILLWVVTFYFVGLYRRPTSIMPEVDEFVLLVKAVSIASLELMAVTFLFEGFPESRYVIVYTWGLGIVILMSVRLLLYRLERFLSRKGFWSRRALILGGDEFGQDVAEKLFAYPSMGVFYVGTLDDAAPKELHFHLRDRFNYLGKIKTYKKVIEDEAVDILFITARHISESLMEQIVAYCEDRQIEVRLLSDAVDIMAGTVEIMEFDGLPFIVQSARSFWRFDLFLKRVLDTVCSIALLLLSSPLFFLITVWIKMVSPSGPVFYKQERVTLNDKRFNMLKFRTMIPNAESQSGPVMVNEKGDDRYILGGEFLRKFSLDELPQFINVLLGDMSLVGPRPERPFFVEEFSKEIPYFRFRHQMRGGITGWAQVNGRSVLTRRPKHKLKYDLYYIKNWSLLLDLKILIKTVSVVLAQEEAY